MRRMNIKTRIQDGARDFKHFQKDYGTTTAFWKKYQIEVQRKQQLERLQVGKNPENQGGLVRKWKRWVKCELEKFGESSGLFDTIEICILGKSTSDPFQIRLKHGNGPPISLIDVGYSVSQILHILVPILREKTESRFLLQQPELHLHPRTQAQLASFLINMHKAFNHGFVVETHSDYIVDRTRIEIMKGNINPEMVSLIYFQPVSDGNKIKVHNIDLDKQANLIGAPTSFRDFFMRESDQLLGIQD